MLLKLLQQKLTFYLCYVLFFYILSLMYEYCKLAGVKNVVGWASSLCYCFFFLILINHFAI